MDLTLQEFEKKFAQYNNIKYAVAVNSGTAALRCCINDTINFKAEKSLCPQTPSSQRLTR